MNQTTFNHFTCDQVLDYLDSSVDSEIDEKESGLLRHVETCPRCTDEIQARRDMRNRLRTAVRSIEVPPRLEHRVRASVQPAKVYRMPLRRAWSSDRD